jgi:ATP-dependent DNA helicase RecQ
MDTSLFAQAIALGSGENKLESARHKLHTVFGYKKFLGQQETIIEHVLSGRDALVVLPAGAGKSLCYQLPALILEGVTIVIEPETPPKDWRPHIFEKRGIRAFCFDASWSEGEVSELRSELKQGSVHLIYVSARDFASQSFLALIDAVRVALFVVHEAQCISKWPFSLRLEYCSLALLKTHYPSVSILAFSRVAEPLNRQEVMERLSIGGGKIFVASLEVPNISYEVSAGSEGRAKLLHFILAQARGMAGIVFCATSARAEEVATWLSGNNLPAIAIHAGLSDEKRRIHQERFEREEGTILVTTSGSGVVTDRSNVRFVAHLDLPVSLDSYYLEAGLAGRDGLPAKAWLAYNALDAIAFRNSLVAKEGSGELRKHIEIQKLDALIGFCEGMQCRRKVLLSYFGERAKDTCGACDLCRSPVSRWDGTQAARKVLVVVHETEQQFGLLHLVDILVGKKAPAVIRHRHDQLKIFGSGIQLSRRVWQSVIRQLLANGYLRPEATGFGALRYTEKGLSVLKGQETVFFRGETKISRVSKPFTRPIPSRFDPLREQLYQALKERRSAIARAMKAPDDQVLNDSILAEIVRQKPRSNADLLRIPGVTEKKTERFGDEILEVLSMFVTQRS